MGVTHVTGSTIRIKRTADPEEKSNEKKDGGIGRVYKRKRRGYRF